MIEHQPYIGRGSNDEQLGAISSSIRKAAVHAIHRSGGGHYGGTLSAVDIVASALHRFGWTPQGPDGNKLILSKGHGAMALYAGLSEFGFMPSDLLARFGASPDDLQGHPDIDTPVPLGFSTGSLGQGLSAALGMAMILRQKGHTACAILGDGECQEGQVWEAAMLAHRLTMSNLIAIVDANNHQEWGYRTGGRATRPVVDLEKKWAAFGWSVTRCDGHDHGALAAALDDAVAAQGPAVVIAQTRKGYGSRLLEGDPDRFHCASLTEDEFSTVMWELGR